MNSNTLYLKYSGHEMNSNNTSFSARTFLRKVPFKPHNNLFSTAFVDILIWNNFFIFDSWSGCIYILSLSLLGFLFVALFSSRASLYPQSLNVGVTQGLVFRYHLVSITQAMLSYSVSGLKESFIHCRYLTLFLRVWLSLCIHQWTQNHLWISPSNQKLKVQNEFLVCLHKSIPSPVLHTSWKSSISPSSARFKLLSILLDLPLTNHTSLSPAYHHVPLILPSQYIPSWSISFPHLHCYHHSIVHHLFPLAIVKLEITSYLVALHLMVLELKLQWEDRLLKDRNLLNCFTLFWNKIQCSHNTL